jgi:hypothetical protein
MNKMLVMAAGIIAVIGLILNVTLDFDNVYDMTMVVLWSLTIILALLGAFLVKKETKPTAN